MIKTTMDIAANSNPSNNRSGPSIIRPIPISNKFTFHLHKSGPDIIAKLNLHDRFESSQSHTDSHAHNTCFSQRRVENPLLTKLCRQTFSSSKYAPFTISYILTEHKYFLIVFEFLMQGMVNSVHHNDLRTCGGRCFIFKSIPESAFIKYMFYGSLGFRIRGKNSFIGCGIYFFSDFLLQSFIFLLRNEIILNHIFRKKLNGAFFQILLQIFRIPIFPLVIGRRMRQKADNLSLDKSRSLSTSYIFNCLSNIFFTFEIICPIYF